MIWSKKPEAILGGVDEELRGLCLEYFKYIRNGYDKRLAPLVQRVLDEPLSLYMTPSLSEDFIVVQRVYQDVIKNARFFENSDPTLYNQMIKETADIHPPLSDSRLQDILKWTEDQRKISDTLTMFMSISQSIPELQKLILNFAQDRDLGPTKKKEKILEWANSHQGLLSRITELDLSRLSLTYLCPEIRLFTNLKVLNLSYNPLHELPKELKQLRNLTLIIIRHTPLGTKMSKDSITPDDV